MAVCDSCGAEIIWTKTPKGKRIPLNAQPDRVRGNVTLLGSGNAQIGVVLSGESAAAAREDGPMYLSHFATCPKAEEHRRG